MRAASVPALVVSVSLAVALTPAPARADEPLTPMTPDVEGPAVPNWELHERVSSAPPTPRGGRRGGVLAGGIVSLALGAPQIPLGVVIATGHSSCETFPAGRGALGALPSCGSSGTTAAGVALAVNGGVSIVTGFVLVVLSASRASKDAELARHIVSGPSGTTALAWTF